MNAPHPHMPPVPIPDAVADCLRETANELHQDDLDACNHGDTVVITKLQAGFVALLLDIAAGVIDEATSRDEDCLGPRPGMFGKSLMNFLKETIIAAENGRVVPVPFSKDPEFSFDYEFGGDTTEYAPDRLPSPYLRLTKSDAWDVTMFDELAMVKSERGEPAPAWIAEAQRRALEAWDKAKADGKLPDGSGIAVGNVSVMVKAVPRRLANAIADSIRMVMPVVESAPDDKTETPRSLTPVEFAAELSGIADEFNREAEMAHTDGRNVEFGHGEVRAFATAVKTAAMAITRLNEQCDEAVRIAESLLPNAPEPSPEVMAKFGAAEAAAAEHGVDHPLTHRLMLDALEAADPGISARLLAESGITMPDPVGVDDDGRPLYSSDELAAAAGVSREEIAQAIDDMAAAGVPVNGHTRVNPIQ